MRTFGFLQQKQVVIRPRDDFDPGIGIGGRKCGRYPRRSVFAPFELKCGQAFGGLLHQVNLRLGVRPPEIRPRVGCVGQTPLVALAHQVILPQRPRVGSLRQRQKVSDDRVADAAVDEIIVYLFLVFRIISRI